MRVQIELNEQHTQQPLQSPPAGIWIFVGENCLHVFLHKLCWFSSPTGLGTALPRQYWNKARNALASWSPGLCWLAGQYPDAAGRQQAWHCPPILSGGWAQVTCPWQHSGLARSLSATGHPSMELLGKGSFRRPWYPQTGPFTGASSRNIEAIIYDHIHTLIACCLTPQARGRQGEGKTLHSFLGNKQSWVVSSNFIP